MIKLKLKSIKKFLKLQGFICEMHTATEELPLDLLLVYLEDAEEFKGMVLQIRIVRQKLEDEDEIMELREEPGILQHVQFSILLPYEVKREFVGDLARLILLFNRSIDLPGFEFSEMDKMVLYRHTGLYQGGKISEHVLVSIIGNILTSVEVFGGYLEALGAGERTFREIVEEIQKIRETGEI